MSRKATRRTSTKTADPPPTWDETLIRTLTPLKTELFGALLILLAALTLLGHLELLTSPYLLGWSALLYQLFGWGLYPLLGLLALGGFHLLLRRVNRWFRLRPGHVIGAELLLLASLPLTYHWSGADLIAAYRGEGGGLVGWALAAPTLDFLGPLLTVLLYGLLWLLGLLLVVGVRWQQVHAALAQLSAGLEQWAQRLAPPPRPDTPRPVRPTRREPLPLIEEQPLTARPAPLPSGRDPRLPAIDLLEQGSTVPMSETEVREKKRIVEQTLVDFGLTGQVTEIRSGPAVTQFGVRPGYLEKTGPDGEPMQHKVRVGQIAALRKDLALALQVPRLRIQAPVPGRGTVGIEIPNHETSVVRLRSVVESQAFAQINGPLAVALGQDVSGVPVAINLAKMPHLLIAGATGTGKSVCLNAFISCLVFNNAPEDLKLVMIDPKKVELIRFNGLPHLLGKVEVDGERVIGVLRWLMQEMDQRYQKFAILHARNLEVYNRKVQRLGKGAPLPHIAVFIDELADLMAMYSSEVERALCRLAQMARATGIHLVVATQRPSTDVLTGLIKANFPARISFAVTSNVDSRVILDTTGAEELLGRGDMLFLSSDAGEPVRVQSCFVSDNEIERLVDHWRQVMPGREPEEAPWESIIARIQHIEETDDMLEEAIALAQAYDTISTSFMQRKLRVGFPRAARLMEALHDMGLVEDPKEGGKTRRSFVDEGEDPLDRYLSEQ